MHVWTHEEVESPLICILPRREEAAAGWSPLASSCSTDREFLDSGGSVRSRRFCSVSLFRISCFLGTRRRSTACKAGGDAARIACVRACSRELGKRKGICKKRNDFFPSQIYIPYLRARQY